MTPFHLAGIVAGDAGHLRRGGRDRYELSGAARSCGGGGTLAPQAAGTVRFERSTAEVLRDFILGHLIQHWGQIQHRGQLSGQLSVYLRRLDLPVPGAYGPTADDRS